MTERPSANLRTNSQLLILDWVEEQLVKGMPWEVPIAFDYYNQRISHRQISQLYCLLEAGWKVRPTLMKPPYYQKQHQPLNNHQYYQIPFFNIPFFQTNLPSIFPTVLPLGSRLVQLLQQVVDSRYIVMGQQESKQHSLIDNKNWRLVSEEESQLFHHTNPYCTRALYNAYTGECVEEYELQFISEQDYLSYAKELELRKEPAPYQVQAENSPENTFRLSPYIYKVKYFLNTSSVDLCSTIHKGLLYLQKVDLRLKEINDIPFADQLCLLQATLQGFKVLYQKVGYFDISEEMIFISYRGKVRVWMNPNLAKNLPYYVPRVHESTHLHGSQSEMIVNLINMIEENTDIQNSEAIHFKQYLINKGILDRLSFYKALEEFHLYCLENRLIVHDYMRSIYDISHEDLHHLGESRAEHSEVVRLETNRQFNLIDKSASNSKSKSKSNHRNRNYSPDFTAIKKSKLFGSHASQKSHASYKSMGEKSSNYNQKSRHYDQRGYKDPMQYPSIPPLPITTKSKHPSQAFSPRPVNQISFAGSGFDIFNNELSLNQLQQNMPFVPSSRRNSIRNVRRVIEEGRMNPTAVTFNYAPPPSTSIPADKQTAPNNQRTIGTMNSMSSFSKETELCFEARPNKDHHRMTYHSHNNAYNLDHEIIEDLQKYLGFDINQL